MKRIRTDRERIHGILEVLMSYARMEFDTTVKLSDSMDEIDAIGLGINMMGEELRASALSVREKDALLREIHHRVKNNLQVISSLLNLQVKRDSDIKLREYAREGQSRIKTIALIHELLYRTNDSRHTDFRIYVHKLVEMLNETFSTAENRIAFQLEIPENLKFDLDRMIPLGLIINEAVSNSLKHAFPGGSGKVSITYNGNTKSGNLVIEDNGIGFEENFDCESDQNTGLQLIRLLSEQADMEMKMSNHTGLRYELIFKRKH